jgi:hypothetical protein
MGEPVGSRGAGRLPKVTTTIRWPSSWVLPSSRLTWLQPGGDFGFDRDVALKLFPQTLTNPEREWSLN